MAKYKDWITEDGLTLIRYWRKSGLSERQVAEDQIHVSYSTLNEWKKRFSELADALNKGKQEAVADIVENALFKRAKGYRYKEVTSERVFNHKTGEFELVPVKEITKEVPPDMGAIAFYLKNMDPEHWKDRRDIDMTVQGSDKLADIMDQIGGEGLDE